MKNDALKAVFVHIPKNGGTSIERVLFPKEIRTVENFWMGFNRDKYFPVTRKLPRWSTSSMMNRYQTDGLQHLTALQMRHAMGRELYESYYRFAVVRHPTKRSLSQYKYMQERADLRWWIGMKRSDSFLTYLKKTYNRHHAQWQDQVSFIYDHRGNSLVHDIIKLENVDEGMQTVFDALGVPQMSVPHLNKSKKPKKAGTSISDNERDILWELYKYDFEVFDYNIDD